MKSTYLIKGLIKSVPGIQYVYKFNRNTGGSCNARYCYSVWLRHLFMAYSNGFDALPKVVAELGPGDSLGCGLAALISGADKYYALDIQKYTNSFISLKIFDELVLLFKQKTPIPDENEFPRIRPLLPDYAFPSFIFNDNYLKDILSDNRIESIRESIKTIDESYDSKVQSSLIEYLVPWNKNLAIEPGTVDMVFSQAALQAVDELKDTYDTLALLLKPNGLQSHDIGFKSCGSADKWYGHWEYSDTEWKIVRGRKNFFINREPYSTHIQYLKESNAEIIMQQKVHASTRIKREKLASRFRNIPDEDLYTFSLFIQAQKKK